jgi:hypothetical protein
MEVDCAEEISMTGKSFQDIMRAAGVAASKMRRDYLPGDASATEISISLEATQLAALDAWIASQPDPKPDRKEAIRRLLDRALISR